MHTVMKVVGVFVLFVPPVGLRPVPLPDRDCAQNDVQKGDVWIAAFAFGCDSLDKRLKFTFIVCRASNVGAALWDRLHP
jgi:hypothetical protein